MSEPPSAEPPRHVNAWHHANALVHLLVSLAAGLVAGVVAGLLHSPGGGALVAWLTAATVFLVWTWTAIWPLDAADTARLAQREDPSRPIRDLVLLVVSVASLLTVALVLFRAHRQGPLLLILGVGCVLASWAVVHTVFALGYARTYFTDPVGGLEFNQDEPPCYRDFAYVAFTVGMTFQVSDTSVSRRALRDLVLRQALVAYLFGAIIIAVTINLVAGLSS